MPHYLLSHFRNYARSYATCYINFFSLPPLRKYRSFREAFSVKRDLIGLKFLLNRILRYRYFSIEEWAYVRNSINLQYRNKQVFVTSVNNRGVNFLSRRYRIGIEGVGNSEMSTKYNEECKKQVDCAENILLDDCQTLNALSKEYSRLRNKFNPTETDLIRIQKLLELAFVDDELENRLKEIDDEIIEREESVNARYRAEDNNNKIVNLQQSRVYEFNDLLNNLLTNKASFFSNPKLFFKDLCCKLKLSKEVIEHYVHFSEDTYQRRLLFCTPNMSATIISWKPGQKSQLHLHKTGFCFIYVYSGELSVEHLKLGEDSRLDSIKTYSKGKWCFSPSGVNHKLGNNSETNLVTVHYRYFPDDSLEHQQVLQLRISD